METIPVPFRYEFKDDDKLVFKWGEPVTYREYDEIIDLIVDDCDRRNPTLINTNFRDLKFSDAVKDRYHLLVSREIYDQKEFLKEFL